MKIGIVCPYAYDTPGGVQFHVRDLALSLIERGHEVRVLAPAEDDAALPPFADSGGRPVPVRFNGSVARLNFGPVTAARVNRWLDRHNFDLIHIHEPVTPSIGILALMAAECPVVATFHTANLRSRAYQAAYPLIRSSLEKITARIAVSEDARRTVTNHIGGDAVVIPNGVYVDAFASAAPRVDWQGSADRPTIAFLGRIGEPRKGLQILGAAMVPVLERFPGARVLIAGPGDVESARERLPAPVRDACEFLGPVSDADKAALLRSADVYVAPNTGGESFGIILIEAMSAGSAVLASDLPAFMRVLDDGRAGASFDNEDPADLGRRLIELLEDPERRAELAMAGQVRARSFDWSVVTDRILAVYETVIEGALSVEDTGSPGLIGRLLGTRDADRVDRAERADRADRAERAERADRAERAERSQRPARAEDDL